jgi:hypothetical protein
VGATAILSPHRDDAVLSLWHVLAGPGEVRVINLFTGAATGTALGWWDQATGAVDPATRADERAGEDRAALALAGRGSQDLGLIDHQYRTGAQDLDQVIDAVAAAAAPDELLLAPAALGDHPDHALARAAALALRQRGRPVALYADVPHAVSAGWPAWVTNGGGAPGDDAWAAVLVAAGLRPADLKPRVHRLDRGEEARKRDAFGCYATQIDGLERIAAVVSSPDVLRYEVVWPLPAP